MTRTRIKICGLTREADVDAAVAAGADAVGFALYAKSPRHVPLRRALALAARLPPFVTPVLLFVNALPDELAQAHEALPQALWQFHGDETPAMCDAAAHPYIRAARMGVRMGTRADARTDARTDVQTDVQAGAAPGASTGLDLLDFAAAYPRAKALLLDANIEGYGGGGKVFDWSQIPLSVPLPLVLSGGLNPANVIDGVTRVRPWAVDVSSGVEVSKGIKDAELMRRFCDAVRAADLRRAT